MRYRNLGKNCGLKVSPICLGTQYFGTAIDEQEALKIFNNATDKGINFVDTADIYGDGKSEIVVGKAIQGRREDVVLATKVFGPMGNGPNDGGLSRYHILNALERSLERLNTDYIDIYLLHDPDYSTPIEETLRALDVCVKSGKIRYIGCCNFYGWQLMEASAISERLNLEKFVCSQPLYNIVNRDIEVELLPLSKKYGIGVTSYSPLARGVLAAKYHLGKKPPIDSRAGKGNKRLFETEWREESFRVADKLKEIASLRENTVTQFALGWVIANPLITSAIIGPRNLEQLEDNLGALDLKITPDDEELVNQLVPPGEHTGKGFNNPDYPARGRPIG